MELDADAVIPFVPFRLLGEDPSARGVGKTNFTHSLFPSMRSIFETVYRVVAAAKDANLKRIGVLLYVYLELLFAVTLLPSRG